MRLGSGGHVVGDAGRLWPNLEAPDIVRDAPRPATILRVADALEFQGGELLGLFREVEAPTGSAVFPLHLARSDTEFFIEVETGLWTDQVIRNMVRRIAVLRASSDGAEKAVLILSAYPVPKEASLYTNTDPATLFRLHIIGAGRPDPETASDVFTTGMKRHLGVEVQPSPEYLPLVEELLASGEEAAVPDELIFALGAFLGETVRGACAAGHDPCGWSAGLRGAYPTLEVGAFVLDPIGKARAFLENGAEDSISFYAGYVLRELDFGIRNSGGAAP